MNRFLITLFYFLTIILCGVNCYGQQDTVFIRHSNDVVNDKLNYTTDTVIFESEMRRHVLTGTTVLPSTHNQQIAREYGLNLDEVTKSDCLQDVTQEGGMLQDKINSILNTDTSLTIDINIYDNCCYDFLCDISVDSSIINLIYQGYGTYCDCDCCFGLTYLLRLENNFDFNKIKSVMLNGLPKTLKEIKPKKF